MQALLPSAAGKKAELNWCVYVLFPFYHHKIWVRTEKTRSWVKMAKMGFFSNLTLSCRVKSSYYSSCSSTLREANWNGLGIFARCFQGASLWRLSWYAHLGEDSDDGRALAWGTVYVFLLGKPWDPPEWAGEFCWKEDVCMSNCYPNGPISDKRKRMEGWKLWYIILVCTFGMFTILSSSVGQGSPTSFLKGRCPAIFRFASTHLAPIWAH